MGIAEQMGRTLQVSSLRSCRRVLCVGCLVAGRGSLTVVSALLCVMPVLDVLPRPAYVHLCEHQGAAGLLMCAVRPRRRSRRERAAHPCAPRYVTRIVIPRCRRGAILVPTYSSSHTARFTCLADGAALSGAMQEAVKFQRRYWGDRLREGDVLVSNHPQLAVLGRQSRPPCRHWYVSTQVNGSCCAGLDPVWCCVACDGVVWSGIVWSGVVCRWHLTGFHATVVKSAARRRRDDHRQQTCGQRRVSGVCCIAQPWPGLLLCDEMLLCDVDC